MTAERRARTRRIASGTAAFAAVMAGASALIGQWEGLRERPYRDLVGIATVCYGETRVPMRRYTRAECDMLLATALRDDLAPSLLRIVPTLADRPGPFVASLSLAWNIGAGAYARSTVARRFRAGDWRGGCDAFLMWNKAGGKVIAGLARRRAAERRLCLAGAA
jgi:lysozyme